MSSAADQIDGPMEQTLLQRGFAPDQIQSMKDIGIGKTALDSFLHGGYTNTQLQMIYLVLSTILANAEVFPPNAPFTIQRRDERVTIPYTDGTEDTLEMVYLPTIATFVCEMGSEEAKKAVQRVYQHAVDVCKAAFGNTAEAGDEYVFDFGLGYVGVRSLEAEFEDTV